MNNIFFQFLKTLILKSPFKISLSLLLATLVSFTESIGLLILIPLLGLIGLQAQDGMVSKTSEIIANIFTMMHLTPTLAIILFIYISVISIHVVLYYSQTIANQLLVNNIFTCLTNELYTAVINTSWQFMSQKKLSDITYTLTLGISSISRGTYFFLQLLVNLVLACVYILFALQISVKITVLVLFLSVTLLVLLNKKIINLYRSSDEFLREDKKFYMVVIEHLNAIKIIKSYNMQEKGFNAFSLATNVISQNSLHTIKSMTKVKCYFDIGKVIFLAFVLYVSVEILGLHIGSVILLVFVFSRTMPLFSNLQHGFLEITKMLPSFKDFLDLKKECYLNKEAKSDKLEKIKLNNYIQVKNISFTYSKEKPGLFSNLNLTIEASKVTAIVGSSGSGKSTICDMIMGLITPSAGQILVDNIPLNPSNIQSWREQIGYVTQDSFLFHDTIKNNLLWANPNANNEDIQQALKLAACEEFISNTPQGIETIIGDRGILLSGGERQRLTLARALLRKPSLLILDEATSSLDSENEKQIQKSIEALQGQITILVIAHRLSTIRKSDIIYILDKGQIIESGTWEELISKEGGELINMRKAQDVLEVSTVVR